MTTMEIIAACLGMMQMLNFGIFALILGWDLTNRQLIAAFMGIVLLTAVSVSVLVWTLGWK